MTRLRAAILYISPRACFAVLNETAASRAFRGLAGLLSSFAEVAARDVGLRETPTAIKHANSLVLAQESAAVCSGGG